MHRNDNISLPQQATSFWWATIYSRFYTLFILKILMFLKEMTDKQTDRKSEWQLRKQTQTIIQRQKQSQRQPRRQTQTIIQTTETVTQNITQTDNPSSRIPTQRRSQIASLDANRIGLSAPRVLLAETWQRRTESPACWLVTAYNKAANRESGWGRELAPPPQKPHRMCTQTRSQRCVCTLQVRYADKRQQSQLH